MTLCSSNSRSNLLGLDGSNLRWPDKQAVKQVKRDLFQRFRLARGVWINVMRGVIAIKRSNVGEFNDIVVEDFHFSERFDANTQRLGWGLTGKALISDVNVLRGNIERFPEHGAGCIVPSHLTAFVCFSEEVSDAIWNIPRDVHRVGCNLYRTKGQGTGAAVNIPILLKRRRSGTTHSENVDGRSRAFRAGSRHLPYKGIFNPCLPAEHMLYLLCPAADAVPNKKCRHKNLLKLMQPRVSCRRSLMQDSWVKKIEREAA